jgi:hypothetical protein
VPVTNGLLLTTNRFYPRVKEPEWVNTAGTGEITTDRPRRDPGVNFHLENDGRTPHGSVSDFAGLSVWPGSVTPPQCGDDGLHLAVRIAVTARRFLGTPLLLTLRPSMEVQESLPTGARARVAVKSRLAFTGHAGGGHTFMIPCKPLLSFAAAPVAPVTAGVRVAVDLQFSETSLFTADALAAVKANVSFTASSVPLATAAIVAKTSVSGTAS